MERKREMLRHTCYDPLVSGCNIKEGSSHKRYQCQLYYLIKLKQQQSVMTIKHTSRNNEENLRNKYKNKTLSTEYKKMHKEQMLANQQVLTCGIRASPAKPSPQSAHLS